MKILIEFLIIFVILYTLYYFFIIKKYKNSKKSKKNMPPEVCIIIFQKKIDPTKIDLYQMIKVVGVATTLILSIAITLMFNVFENNTTLSILIGSILAIVMAIIVYTIIGNYYSAKSQKKDLHKKE